MAASHAPFDPSLWPPDVVSLATHGAEPVDAIFDMDGTLLAEDLGDELVGWLLEQGHRPPAFVARAADHAAYRAVTRGWNTVETFVLCGLITQGLTEAELDQQVRGCMASRVPLRAPVVALARQLVVVGHRVWILTGTSEGAGRAVARILGLDERRVIGFRLRVDPATGRYTDRVEEPVTFGAGKVAAARQRVGDDVGFSIGDSHTDLPLLLHARVAVAVPSLDGRLGPLATAAGIAVRLPEQLGG